jgi:hypothetical protein
MKAVNRKTTERPHSQIIPGMKRKQFSFYGSE